MTQIEIVDLLKESGVWDEIGYPTCIDKLIDLVAAHEREKQAEQEPVAWKHDCAALCTNGVELWVDRCPHCGKPSASPQPVKQEPVGRWNWNEAKFEWLTKFDYHKHHMTPLYAAPVRTKDLTVDEKVALADRLNLNGRIVVIDAVIAAYKEKNK